MATPKQLGPWTIGPKIGSGGQGNVHRARRAEAEPDAAIKILQLPSTKSKRRARFLTEVRAHVLLSEQQAANVMPIIDENFSRAAPDASVGYLVMPLAHTTLARVARTFHGRTELALETFRGIVNGVAEAHARQIIHRDIKPENVLFLSDDLREPQLSDFGICFLKGTDKEDRITDVNETVGSKYFMSPEQYLAGPADVAEAADVYALGKLQIFMLTGRFLRREEIENAFTADELTADPRLSRAAEAILRRTVVYNPADRFQDASQLLAAVDELLREFRGGGGGSPAATVLPPSPVTRTDARATTIPPAQAFEAARHKLREVGDTRLSMDLIDLGRDYQKRWRTEIRPQVDKRSHDLKSALPLVLEAEGEAIGTVLAIATYNASTLTQPLQRLIERIQDASRDDTSYVSVSGVPHITAGFIYMAAAVQALQTESWDVWDWALTTTFKWYYRSGKPLFSYGFNHSYFFHSEAIGREASSTHNLFRAMLSAEPISAITGLTEEESVDRYLQTQFLMVMRVAQLAEQGDDDSIWPDFGRFYAHRLLEVLERIRGERTFAVNVLRPFRESPEEWLSKLDRRIKFVRQNFWGGSPYMWSSLTGWSQRDT